MQSAIPEKIFFQNVTHAYIKDNETGEWKKTIQKNSNCRPELGLIGCFTTDMSYQKNPFIVISSIKWPVELQIIFPRFRIYNSKIEFGQDRTLEEYKDILKCECAVCSEYETCICDDGKKKLADYLNLFKIDRSCKYNICTIKCTDKDKMLPYINRFMFIAFPQSLEYISLAPSNEPKYFFQKLLEAQTLTSQSSSSPITSSSASLSTHTHNSKQILVNKKILNDKNNKLQDKKCMNTKDISSIDKFREYKKLEEKLLLQEKEILQQKKFLSIQLDKQETLIRSSPEFVRKQISTLLQYVLSLDQSTVIKNFPLSYSVLCEHITNIRMSQNEEGARFFSWNFNDVEYGLVFRSPTDQLCQYYKHPALSFISMNKIDSDFDMLFQSHELERAMAIIVADREKHTLIDDRILLDVIQIIGTGEFPGEIIQMLLQLHTLQLPNTDKNKISIEKFIYPVWQLISDVVIHI